MGKQHQNACEKQRLGTLVLAKWGKAAGKGHQLHNRASPPEESSMSKSFRQQWNIGRLPRQPKGFRPLTSHPWQRGREEPLGSTLRQALELKSQQLVKQPDRSYQCQS